MNSAGNFYYDLQALGELRQPGRFESREALEEAARQFEAIFTGMMVKSMRSATGGENLLDGPQGGMYREMLDAQVAVDLARSGRLGIAEMLVKQLGGSLPEETASTPPDPGSFVKQVWPHARRAAARLGVAAKNLVAQAALETGWGKAVPRHPDGRSSNNLFGIKAGTNWRGDSVTSRTLEHTGGTLVQQAERFRAYESVAASFADYARLLGDNPRYAEVVADGEDGADFAAALQRSGYATDPNYGAKLRAVLDGEVLRDALAPLKDPAAEPIA